MGGRVGEAGSKKSKDAQGVGGGGVEELATYQTAAQVICPKGGGCSAAFGQVCPPPPPQPFFFRSSTLLFNIYSITWGIKPHTRLVGWDSETP